MPTTECAKYFYRTITESQYCAYDPLFKADACQGDSGGPLQFFNANSTIATVVGIVSFGKTKCPSEAPDIYTKVAYYLDWIQSHVWPTETPMKYFQDKNFNDFDSGVFTIIVKGEDHRIYRNYVERKFGWDI